MPTVTHTLEGPDLEALLARVPAELGATATIVAANKLRKGGVGGFFTKELFEVVVEVEVTQAPASARPTPSARSAAEGVAPTSTGPVAVPVVDPPRVSTEAIGFAGVLDRMVRDAGVSDTAPRTIGPALAGSTMPEPQVPETEATTPSDADELEFEPLVPARIVRAAAGVPTAEVAEAPLPLTPPQPPAAAASSAAPGMPLPGPEAPASTGRSSGLAVVDAEPSPLRPAPTVDADLEHDAPAGGLDQRWLARVGLPTTVAAHLPPATADPTTELQRLMQHIVGPEPLPTAPGSVIAVVGRRAEALEVSERFAAELGLSPEEVLVASTNLRGGAIAEERRLTSIDLALERRRGWRRRKAPTIIAVDAPHGRHRTPWAMHLLDAIEPTMVWGVVEASRKPEDIRAWAMGVGGLDALAVTGVEETVSPAAVLGVGVPVGLLDGHAATPARWTAILAEHLEVAA